MVGFTVKDFVVLTVDVTLAFSIVLIVDFIVVEFVVFCT